MQRYDATTIEAKWQEAWNTANTFKAERDESKPKYFVLEMFPYPSTWAMCATTPWAM